MKKNKDEQLTYEELTELCRRQEAYIEELEKKLIVLDETKICEPAKPDYEELIFRNSQLSDENRELSETIQALLYSLKKVNVERLVNEDERRHFQERYTQENKRAYKLYCENEKLQKELDGFVPIDKATFKTYKN